ncbi:Imm50 family immunity protein [Streptomyces collinus]|uniref:Imm50 family immunity protein n=1 Tax=Streptomyces collinus TaxID=42684 RepID=UPI002942894B|nr:Imm50 family immunity protein [Streptomyces collinus]
MTQLYTELPSLDHLVLRSVHLSPYGPGVKLRVELPRFPDLAPPEWTEAGCDRFEAQIEFLGVGEGLRMRGVPNATEVGVEITSFVQSEEHRIAVAVNGPDFLLHFTAHAALMASHLNAYRSSEDPHTARRWFAGGVDQRLHQVLPPTTTRTFYE